MQGDIFFATFCAQELKANRAEQNPTFGCTPDDGAASGQQFDGIVGEDVDVVRILRMGHDSSAGHHSKATHKFTRVLEKTLATKFHMEGVPSMLSLARLPNATRMSQLTPATTRKARWSTSSRSTTAMAHAEASCSCKASPLHDVRFEVERFVCRHRDSR